MSDCGAEFLGGDKTTHVVHKALGIQGEASHHKALWLTTPNHHLVVAHTHPGVHQLVAHTHPGVHSEALGVPGYHTPLMSLDTDINRYEQGAELK